MGKVLAFEPLGHLREKFTKNIALNKADNITLLPFALSNEESEADFTVDKKLWNQGTFSLGNEIGGGDKERITIKKGDGIPEIQNLESLSLVKIDVEGFEFQVIRGLLTTIEKYRPRIIFEYDENYWRDNGQDINDCYLLLKSLNYTLYQVTPVGCELILSPEHIVGGNLFCIADKE
jgi:FkbM family methyltransferase